MNIIVMAVYYVYLNKQPIYYNQLQNMSGSVLTILAIMVISLMIHWRLSDSFSLREQLKGLSRQNEDLSKQLAALTKIFEIQRQQIQNNTKYTQSEIKSIDKKIHKEVNNSDFNLFIFVLLFSSCFAAFIGCCWSGDLWISQISNINKYNKNLTKISADLKQLEKEIPNPIDDNSCNRKLYKIFGKSISLASDSGFYYQLAGKIPFTQSSSVSIKIINMNTQSNKICIGAINQKYISDKNSYKLPGRNIVYYCASGSIFNGKTSKSKGNGYQVNDTVKMSIQGNTMSWSVKGIVKATYTSELLTDQTIIWVPCIWMYNLNDAVEWQ